MGEVKQDGGGAGNWRTKYRQRQHDAAHAADPGEQHAVPSHPDIPAGPAAVVTDQASLDALLTELRDAGLFAYDTEFIGELTYAPRLCVIQVATAKRVVLIDPLAKIDLQGFYELLCDENVVKVVHAGEQDLEPVVRLLGKPACNVFDTQIAAGFCRLPYPLSLSKLVHELTGGKLAKGLTFTHWDQRPLSAMQLRYAADDVRYLISVYRQLHKRLADSGRLHWAQAEFDELCSAERHRFDVEKQWRRIRSSGSLGPKQQSVLRALVQWREDLAVERDVPVRTLLRDEVMLDMARSPVDSPKKFDRIRNIPRPIVERQGDAIIALTVLALANPQEPSVSGESSSEATPAARYHAEAVWSVAQAVCVGLGFDPAVVFSRADASDLSNALLNGGDHRDNRLMRGWRGEAVGKPVCRILAGESAATLASDEDGLNITIDPIDT